MGWGALSNKARNDLLARLLPLRVLRGIGRRPLLLACRRRLLPERLLRLLRRWRRRQPLLLLLECVLWAQSPRRPHTAGPVLQRERLFHGCHSARRWLRGGSHSFAGLLLLLLLTAGAGRGHRASPHAVSWRLCLIL